ncbi:DUF3592 domain-containing protein [Corallococcus llansteffanensis]|uniref:DUF3592 domain-containing protein n=1 Tax=Corallococcus llansteffanensis TaxID=2316731 RepID=A0A3A8QH96_9BACT|nr:DUF3592 domain-containing protein [Corallococcus llansteffanensis]RKH67041.1 hypothetical protein D7V93_03465 [Corallococcus llansteffanensis]
MSTSTLIGFLVGGLGFPTLLLGLLIYIRGGVVRLERRGLHAQGKVLRVQYPRTNKRTVYYTFRPPEGPEFQGNFQEWPPGPSERAPGSPVDVLYLEEAPHDHMAAGKGLSRRFFLIAATLLVLFASLCTHGVLQEYFAPQGQDLARTR